MIKRLLFRAVFAGYILIQILLLAALLAFVSEYWPTYWPTNVSLSLFLMLLFLIGAGSYLAFQRVTRVESVRLKAEKWLLERERAKAGVSPNWRKIVKRCSVWAPTLIVMAACAFLGETFAIASHLLHPGSGKLLRYQVSIPLSWTVTISEPDVNGKHSWSLVAATRTRGMVVAGLAVYLRRTPSLSISDMTFYGAPDGDPTEGVSSPFPSDVVISSRILPFGKRLITCWEYKRYSRGRQDDRQFITCSTPGGDFFCHFGGDGKDIPDFYRTLQSVKQIESNASTPPSPPSFPTHLSPHTRKASSDHV